MHIKKHLSFSAQRKSISELLLQINDHRQSGKVNFELHDCLMSALAMMFFQDPSLLSFQRRMQDNMQCYNLKSMFGLKAIPSDAVLRKAIDGVATILIDPCFSVLFQRLQRANRFSSTKWKSIII